MRLNAARYSLRKKKQKTAGKQREGSLTYTYCSLLRLAAVIMGQRERI